MKKITFLFSILLSFLFIILFGILQPLKNPNQSTLNFNLTGNILAAVKQDTSKSDKLDGSWILGANVISARYEGTGAFWRSSTSSNFAPTQFFLGGDSNGTGALAPHVDKYNVLTNTWTRVAPMPIVVWYNAAVVLGDSLYLVGGMTNTNFSSAINNVQKYDINANTWSTRASYPTVIAWNRLCAYQDSLIYSLGGFANGTSSGTADVYLYNSKNNSWRPATSMPLANCGFATAITGDTIVVICGGYGYQTGQTKIVRRGLISQSDRSQITWTIGAIYPGVSTQRWGAAPWGCRGVICGNGSPSGWGRTTECYVYFNNTWYAQPVSPSYVCSCAYGSFQIGLFGKWIVASGYRYAASQMSPYTNIYTDTLCEPVGIEKNINTIPNSFALSQNFPNPFNPLTTIEFALPKISYTKFIIFDVLGKEIETLINEELKAGSYKVDFDGSKLSSGVYFYKLIAGDFIETKKMILIK